MHHLKQEQFLPITLETAWEFFSIPDNLNLLTPEDMIFKTTSAVPDKMYEGLMITYQITPMFNIPVSWCTEITHIREHAYFVDEQRKGPFNIWHHEHHFKAVEGGVLMTDLLHYDIGKWIFGWISGRLFVHKRVKAIFDYRFKKLETHFGAKA